MEPRPRLDIRLLGELTVLVDGRVVPIAGRQQQVLLTLLAFRANQVVAHDRLIEALWGSAPPSTAESGLRVSVSKLRRALGDSDSPRVLVTQPGGYLLRVGENETDLGRFQALVAEASRLEASSRAGPEAVAGTRPVAGPTVPGT